MVFKQIGRTFCKKAKYQIPHLASFGSKKRKVLFNEKKSQRRQRMESLTALQVLLKTFHEHHLSSTFHSATNTERAQPAKESLMV